MATIRSSRYYENFDMPKPDTQTQEAPKQPDMEPAPSQMTQEQSAPAGERLPVQNESMTETGEPTLPQTERSANRMEQGESIEDGQTERVTPSPEDREPIPVPAEPASPNGELVFDVSNDEFAAENSQGEILVQAVSARGTRPVPEAAVIIYKNRDGENKVVSFYLTDEDGRTPNIPVPAPAKEDSQSPSDTLPFADYNIAVRHPMYYTAMIDNVQVFGDELTIQTVEMIPLPEFVNERDTTKTVVIPKQNL